MQLVQASPVLPKPFQNLCITYHYQNFTCLKHFLQLSPEKSRPSLRWRAYCSQSEQINPKRLHPERKRKYVKSQLRQLTRRIMELSRRKQLHQVFKEVGEATERLGKVNIIVMNAVLSACVHCKDVDHALHTFQHMSKPGGCGVDNISYGILIKGLGEAQRLDEAFGLIESIERGAAPGNPKLSEWLLRTLLNAFVEKGDINRARGILKRFRSLCSQMGLSIFVYNLLIKGYARSDNPLEALKLHKEILYKGLKPDRLTYNTLIMACVRGRELRIAMDILREMKEEGQRLGIPELMPNVVTYTTLLKGFGCEGNLDAVLNIVTEMKAANTCFLDRVAYTAMIDAFLAAGSTSEALRVFEELLEKSRNDPSLRPKAHVYLSLMRALAEKGDLEMVKNLHLRMLPECAGNPSLIVRAEGDELLIEAAINNGQVALAQRVLHKLIRLRKNIPLSDRACLAVVRLQAIIGFSDEFLSPYVLQGVSLEDPIEKIMLSYAEANPLPASLQLCKVVMRFFRDNAVPVTDCCGRCIGIVYREDCNKLNAELSSMMRSPPQFITSCTSVRNAISLLLDLKDRMLVVVESNFIYDETHGFSRGRTLGFLTRQHLFRFLFTTSNVNRLQMEIAKEE